MILFLNDWNRYPNAIVHTKTSNKSFLNLASLYKQMGVKNYFFHLALLNQELENVDPYSDELTQEQKIQIGIECFLNPWYFFREVLRVPTGIGLKTSMLRANRGNIALIWLFFNSITVALIQPRQTGKSTSTDSLMILLIFILMKKTTILLLTKDEDLRKKNIQRLKDIRDNLPNYLIPKSRTDPNNQETIGCSANEVIYNTAIKQTSEKAAYNLGRGFTSPILHCDEAPYIDFIGTVLDAARPATMQVSDYAEQTGQIHGTIFTTTAGKRDDRDGAYFFDMLSGSLTWSEFLFDSIDRHHLKDIVKKNSKTIMVNCTFSHRQLGYTDEWMYEKIRELNLSPAAANRDMFNIWTSGSQSSPLTVEQNQKIKSGDIDPIYMDITPDNFALRWYIEKDEIEERMNNGHYVIGLDTSDALGDDPKTGKTRDGTAIVITDIKDLSVICSASFNQINLWTFAKFLANFLIKYKNTTLIIEKKHNAQVIIDIVIQMLQLAEEDPFKRMFNRIVDEYNNDENEFKEIQLQLEYRDNNFYNKRKGKFGFVTDGSKRDFLFSKAVFTDGVDQAGHLIKDKAISQQMRSLLVKNGRIDHSSGNHDDLVIAWLLTHWFIKFARNLSHYNIVTNDILSDIDSEKKNLTVSEQLTQIEQNLILNEVEMLITKLNQHGLSYAEEYKCQQKLNYLMKKVETTEVDIKQSMESLKNTVEEQKNKFDRFSKSNYKPLNFTSSSYFNNNAVKPFSY